MGEAKIDTGEGSIFNMTPSPGGTSCLENAEIDMRTIAKYLEAKIDEEALRKDLWINDEENDAKDFSGVVIK